MSYNDNFVSVVIPAAGMGKRMKRQINKQYIMLKDRPILAHTINKFESCEYIDEIIVVVREDEIDYCRKNIIEEYGFRKVKRLIAGGKERQDSVYNGICAVNEKCKIILIHDGARPFVTVDNIIYGIKGAMDFGACVIGVPVKDTIKVVDSCNNIVDTPDRQTLWAVHTPQCFQYDLLLKAYERARKEGIIATDDSNLVERIGCKVRMIKGSYNNIKITTPEDLVFGEAILKK